MEVIPSEVGLPLPRFVIYLPYIESRNPNCAHRLAVAYARVKDAYIGSRLLMQP